ncbi:MAG: 3-oxoacyl-ACP reductase family protein [Bryobacteraceae bacterium]|jgi:NAD(P)-dependent dehydrogenase (short-subunit alcohol dehydrogenase family)
MAIDLSGKTALVTGAGKGIGRCIALELARAGCDVAVNDRSDGEGAEGTVAQIEALGRRAFSVCADVGLARDVGAMFDEVFRRFERLHIHVNNAGVQTFRPLLDLEEEEWDRVIDTNLKGCFLCTQRAARHMRERGGGRIVNIGSGCNKIAFPNLGSYTASKGGIEMLTKVAAVELGPYGITVNCVAPGAILIERTSKELSDYAGTFARRTPMGRVGAPEDVAQLVAFLASDGAGFITGQTVFVDGGLFSKPQWPYD